MDIYEPDGDMATNRPAIVLAFGGSFITGQRQDLASLCQYYASRGFVAVTIDYRLYDGSFFPLPDSTAMTDVVAKAVGDMRASVRFLRANASTTNDYGIDPNMIFVGGVSAGAITANYVAMLDSSDVLHPGDSIGFNNNGGFEGNTAPSTLAYSSAAQGLLNFSGAMRWNNYVSANDPAIFSAHDDNDGVVPYAYGSATILSQPIVSLEGSFLLDDRANQEGLSHHLITIPNSNGHVSYFGSGASAMWQDSILNTSAMFLHDNVVCPMATSVAALPSSVQAVAYPNPASDQVTIQLNEVPSAYRVQLYNSAGQLVRSTAWQTADQYQVARQDLSAGLYYLQLEFEDGQQQSLQTKVVFQ